MGGLPPGVTVHASFVDRPNRFLVRARLDHGTEVDAYLPNTARLWDLLVPGVRLVLRHEPASHRRTAYTVTRVWGGGGWVAVEASLASRLVVSWLEASGELAGHGPVTDIEREVRSGDRRLDLAVTAGGRRVWMEVKSTSRAENGEALLSATPSQRGAAHLAELARLAGQGEAAMVVFVVQRVDAERLRLDGDPGWVEAVHAAREAGVALAALGCDVTPESVTPRGWLPVVGSGEDG